MSGPLDGFLPPVRRWFSRTFRSPSPAQEAAWPVIRGGDSVLLLAPTGSGKTLAAFLAAIDELFRRARAGQLDDGVHVLYVTPLKALGNDIHRNLLGPLQGIRAAARDRLPELRVAVRTGDTPQSERQQMIRRPPHLLITTPESLFLLLGSGRMVPALSTVRTVIVDEVHALCDSKRGVHLAVSLERLQARLARPLQRIGCSATLSPLDQIARFLVGHGPDGAPRPCRVVDAGMRKDLDVQVTTPLPDFVEASSTALWSSAYELLLDEVRRHRTTLVFCNSRYKAERTWLRLTEQAEGDDVRLGVHHGSMSRETRLEAEESLKTGQLNALVATSSLELGIDVGSIDLVYQLESPGSVATGLQRIGRAGHLLDATSKGRVLVFDRDELMEAAAVCRGMLEGTVDAVTLPRGCLDVLAQQIVGAVAERDWLVAELHGLMRQAYPYTDLSLADFEAVVGMLAGEPAFDIKEAPQVLVLWDRATGRLAAGRSAAHVAAMCVGTIAEVSEYDVAIARSGKRIGRVQSEFVDDSLRADDVFVLGSTAWRVVGKQRNQLLVEEAPAATPTVPWWHGHVPPRTPEVGVRVGQLRRLIASRLTDPTLVDDLQRQYHVSPHAAAAMVTYVREQVEAVGHVPDHEHLLVETWVDELGKTNVILHCPLGRRLNEAWGQAVCQAARQRLRQQWSCLVSNDQVVLTRQDQPTVAAAEAAPAQEPTATRGHRSATGSRARSGRAAGSRSRATASGAGTAGSTADDCSLARRLLSLVQPAGVASLVDRRADAAAGGGAAFRNAAVCALQILRAYRGKRTPLWLQNYRAEELARAAGRVPGYPVFREVRRAFLHETVDTPRLERFLQRLQDGEVTLTFRRVESPSPFVHTLLVRDLYRSDHQMGRDRRAHLLRLHRQVLQEVLSSEELAELLDARAIERLEERLLFRSEVTRARSSDELAQAIRELGDVPATLEAVRQIVVGDLTETLGPLLRDHRVVAVTLPDCEQDPVRLVTADQWAQYRDAAAAGPTSRPIGLQVARLEDRQLTGFEPGSPTRLIPARWRRPQPRQAARRAIVERYLRRRGPVTLYELADTTGFPMGQLQQILDALVAEGSVAQGVYRADKPRPQWVNRAILSEIHYQTLALLRRELAACAPHEVVDFMVRWQHLHPATRLQGLDGLRQVIGQLQGLEVLQGVLEPEVLAGRVSGYRPEMLERLIGSGEVCWRRVDPRRIKRVLLTLCLRRDLPWLTAGVPVELDTCATADADIRTGILAVREHFARRHTAFFDDVVADTGLDAGTVERAVWHLAWCGELNCDTYEGLRHADFRATVSACYDLATTPQNILHPEAGALHWNMSTQIVVDRLRRRHMDVRLGRWSATERLVPDGPAPAVDHVVRQWAGQLLRRWGVVSRQLVDAETAAPSWSDLVPELKRQELLGQVQRGYFIEAHVGEQYGLPEAIELLRDCRGRRPEGELGYLPDEPLLPLSSRDPANLYSTCFDITRQDGQVFARHQRAGNTCHRYVLQAGQVLLYEDRQLVSLERDALRRCVELVCHDAWGRPQKVTFGSWNGYPMKVSPVAAVLAEAGFAPNSRGQMAYPPPRGAAAPSAASPSSGPPQTFLPYYLEPQPVAYDRAWILGLAGEAVRTLLAEVLTVLEGVLPARGWDLRFHSRGMGATYRSKGRLHLHVGRRWIDARIGTATLVDAAGKKHRMMHWHQRHLVRLESVADLTGPPRQRLDELLSQAEAIVDAAMPRE